MKTMQEHRNDFRDYCRSVRVRQLEEVCSQEEDRCRRYAGTETGDVAEAYAAVARRELMHRVIMRVSHGG